MPRMPLPFYHFCLRGQSHVINQTHGELSMEARDMDLFQIPILFQMHSSSSPAYLYDPKNELLYDSSGFRLNCTSSAFATFFIGHKCDFLQHIKRKKKGKKKRKKKRKKKGKK